MLWLSRRPEWQRSREFETTTNSSSPGFYGYRESDNAFTEEEPTDEEVSGKTRMRVVFQPTSDTTHTIFYRGHWLRVRRGRKSNGYEMLSIRYAPNTWLPPISVDTLAAVSSLVTIRSSSSSSSRRKKSMKPKLSTAFKYILPIPMVLGVIPTPDTSARYLLSSSTRA
jgi:hypothetical protein